jgi:hypothetical protein
MILTFKMKKPAATDVGQVQSRNLVTKLQLGNVLALQAPACRTQIRQAGACRAVALRSRSCVTRPEIYHGCPQIFRVGYWAYTSPI